MRPGTHVYLLVALTLQALGTVSAFACDPCSLYNAARLQGLVPGTFSMAVSNQYSTFDRPKGTQENSTRNGEFVREFSTTQVAAAYDFNQEYGLQVTLPVITRIYDQVKDYRYDTKSESGIGDLLLTGRYSFLNIREADWSIIGGVSAGLKLPTGDTGTLGEVKQEEEPAETQSANLRHHTAVASASGGRALTLGSGSIDYLMGANLFLRKGRMLLLTDLQYMIRTEGSFDYEFANDFIWSTGPGYYLYLDDHNFVATRFAVTGEFKGADKLDGNRVAGSSFSNYYMGPEVLFNIGSNISGQLGVDMRTTSEDAGASVVPEMRIRSALSYRF